MSASSHRSQSRSSHGSIAEYRLVRMRPTLILTAILLLALALASASGCGNNRTIFVPEDSPMRLGPNVKARVWVRVDGSKEWVLSGNAVELPEGYWIVPTSYVREQE